VNFGGYLLPTHYSGINLEHHAVRTDAGLFDVSHMGEFIISGADAEKFLQKMTVNDISMLSYGQAQYSVMCYDDGGIVDDLLIYKKENHFMLVVNASNLKKDLDWLNSHIEGNVQIKDVSEQIGLLALQGPQSRAILQKLTDSNLNNLQFYNFEDGKVLGKEALISRTGYTGEMGFELYAKIENILELWDALMDIGSDKKIIACGLGCRDTLRMEMKYCLYGNDINKRTNPFEAGLAWITKLNKDNFIGKKSLLKAKESIKRKLVAISMTERAIPRNGCPVMLDGEIIGEITSGTMSPTLQKGIGIAYINIPYNKVGTELLIDIRGKMKTAIVVKPPFYKAGTVLD
jgi:aminomethyltransferase